MYINKCSKCGKEFETKNPKRVICPECLYPDRSPLLQQDNSQEQNKEEQPKQENQSETNAGSYSFGGEERPQRNYNNYNSGNYNRDNRQGGYDRGGYNRGGNNGGYNRDRGGYNRNNQGGGFNRGGNNGGYNRDRGGFNRNQGGYNRNNQGGGFNRGGNNNFRRQGGFKRPAKKALLVSREQLAMIEVLYKRMLPLPNPDAHEVIGAEIGLEPNKVFFGINLVRQKLHLPKLPFPKRKLAISAEQLMAIKSLYEPMLPLPPIGCHKILAAQLKMDEWRVHVGIGLIRKQMGLDRWNQDREDAPEEYKNAAKENKNEEEQK